MPAALALINAPSAASFLATAYAWTGVSEPLTVGSRCTDEDCISPVARKRLRDACAGGGCRRNHEADPRHTLRCYAACVALSRFPTCHGIDFQSRGAFDAALAANADDSAAKQRALDTFATYLRQRVGRPL